MLEKRIFGLRVVDILVIIWAAYTMWKALGYESSGDPARALFWLVFIWLVLWLTDPWRKR